MLAAAIVCLTVLEALGRRSINANPSKSPVDVLLTLSYPHLNPLPVGEEGEQAPPDVFRYNAIDVQRADRNRKRIDDVGESGHVHFIADQSHDRGIDMCRLAGAGLRR